LLCTNYLIVYPLENKAWLIPTIDLADITCISLKNRYDSYLLTNNRSDDNSNNSSELTKLSRDIAEQLRS
jgi:hypothetical protein